jgi:hypothetical protein
VAGSCRDLTEKRDMKDALLEPRLGTGALGACSEELVTSSMSNGSTASDSLSKLSSGRRGIFKTTGDRPTIDARVEPGSDGFVTRKLDVRVVVPPPMRRFVRRSSFSSIRTCPFFNPLTSCRSSTTEPEAIPSPARPVAELRLWDCSPRARTRERVARNSGLDANALIFSANPFIGRQCSKVLNCDA